MKYSSSLVTMAKELWPNRHLLYQLTRRDIGGRYRSSAFGMVWSFAIPLLMLAVYGFVFGVVFEARFDENPAAELPAGHFALTLYCGLIIHSLCAECLTRAPSLMTQHSNYVKKVVFPLEILPVMLLGSSFFHFTMSLMVLLAGLLLVMGHIPLTILYVPLILLPLCLLLLAANWMLASLGVYLRDISHLTGLLSTLLLFLSPIFYPVERLPESYQIYLQLNPLTPVIEQSRHVLIDGIAPDLHIILIYLGVSIITCQIGFWWFQKTRSGFADVL